MMPSARCAFEVTAGVIPGTSMLEYTKRFVITTEQWENNPNTLNLARDAAFDYAQSLINPRMVNWVRMDWVWF